MLVIIKKFSQMMETELIASEFFVTSARFLEINIFLACETATLNQNGLFFKKNNFEGITLEVWMQHFGTSHQYGFSL